METPKYKPQNLYFRKPLLQALAAIFDHPLTLVEAPMGYGKTTAIKEFLNNEASTALWLKIYNSTTGSFWPDFCGLFGKLNPGLAQSLSRLEFPEDAVSLREALRLLKSFRLPAKETAYRQGLYQKAACWYRKTGDYAAAGYFYYRCGNFDRLLELIEKQKARDFTVSHLETLKKYMSECPPQIRSKHPYALLVFAVHLFVHNETALFAETCREVRENVETDLSLSATRRNELLGELLQRPTAIYETETDWNLGSPSILTLYYRESGKLQEQVGDLIAELPCYLRLANGHGSGGGQTNEHDSLRPFPAGPLGII